MYKNRKAKKVYIYGLNALKANPGYTIVYLYFNIYYDPFIMHYFEQCLLYITQ